MDRSHSGIMHRLTNRETSEAAPSCPRAQADGVAIPGEGLVDTVGVCRNRLVSKLARVDVELCQEGRSCRKDSVAKEEKVVSRGSSSPHLNDVGGDT